MSNEQKSKQSLMNLGRLIESREQIPDTEFPIGEQELCERYEALYTGAINDVLREYMVMDQALPPEIGSLKENMKVAGIAFTIKSQPTTQISGEMETRARMLDEIGSGTVVVWDASGDRRAALWGEVMTATCKRKGVRGAVVDGGTRDTRQVLAQEFPVFYRYRTSNGSLGRCLITDYQVPIRIGDATIRPGDIVFGDIDGVLVVPREIAYEVLVRAEEIKGNEKDIRDWVDSGMSVQNIIKKGGYF